MHKHHRQIENLYKINHQNPKNKIQLIDLKPIKNQENHYQLVINSR